MKDKLKALMNEIDCRIGHGAASGGHLEYVREKLDEILSDSLIERSEDKPEVVECEISWFSASYLTPDGQTRIVSNARKQIVGYKFANGEVLNHWLAFDCGDSMLTGYKPTASCQPVHATHVLWLNS